MIVKDVFGTEYENSAAHITLHNGRVFQVPLLDENGVQQADENGFLAVDVDATFAAQNTWLAEHPDEVWMPAE